MPSTIFTIATVATGLLATTASAKGNVAVYWGQGAYQKELSVVCSDPSVDIVNIGFVNGFPKSRNEYPSTNFGNACGGEYFNNPDGTKSGLLKSCDIITRGIKVCKQNNKKVLLSLGGGHPPDYYLPSVDAYKWFADTLWGSFGPVDASYKGPRPFGDAAVDGFDLDIESTVGNLDGKSPNYKSQFYGDFVNYLKSKNAGMLISAAPQCIVPDAHLDDAISKAPFDYIFTQFYNTDSCSAKLGYQQIKQGTTGFTFDKWVQRLHDISASKSVKLYIGLSAGINGAKADHYLNPEEANALITKYQDRDFFGGVMLWEATVSQNNTVYGQGYSNWIKYSLDGTFKDKYKPATPPPTSTKSSTKSTLAPSTKSTSVAVSSTPVSSKTPTAPSSYSASSSVASSSVYHSSSSVVIPSSSYHVSTSSSVYVPSSFSIAPSETSNIGYSSYFSTALPTEVYSTSSASVSPSIVYPEDVSSTLVHSSSPGVSSSTPAASESTPTVSDHSVYPVSSSTTEYNVSSSTTPVGASSTSCTSSTELYTASSKTPEALSTASDYSVEYPTASTKTLDVSSSSHSVGYSASSTAPADASSTPCTTSTEVYPASSKTPEASLSTSEYIFYSESSKVPEVSSKASSGYPVEYSTGYPAVPSSSKVPEYPAEYPATYPAASTQVSASSASEYEVYSTATPTVTKPAESTTTVVTTTYLDTCSTGLTTKTTVITKTVCNSCAKPSNKPEADYPEDWTTSIYVSKTLTVTITKPIHPATDIPAYPTGAVESEYPATPKPSTPAAEYPADKAEVPSYPEVPAEKPSAPAPEYPAAPKPSTPAAEYPVDKAEVPSYPEAPSYPEVPAEKPSAPAAEYPVASSEAATPSKPVVPSYPEDVTVTISHYATLTKVATPVAYTHTPYATPVAHQGYPVNNGTASAVKPSGTGAVKPTSSGKPTYPTSYSPPEFEGAASQLSFGMTGVVVIVAFLML